MIARITIDPKTGEKFISLDSLQKLLSEDMSHLWDKGSLDLREYIVNFKANLLKLTNEM